MSKKNTAKPAASSAASTTPSPTGANDQSQSKIGPSKISNVIALMQREGGASLDEMVKATGWKPHSTRAALTGLRRRGHAITRKKVDNDSRYRIEVSA